MPDTRPFMYRVSGLLFRIAPRYQRQIMRLWPGYRRADDELEERLIKDVLERLNDPSPTKSMTLAEFFVHLDNAHPCSASTRYTNANVLPPEVSDA